MDIYSNILFVLVRKIKDLRLFIEIKNDALSLKGRACPAGCIGSRGVRNRQIPAGELLHHWQLLQSPERPPQGSDVLSTRSQTQSRLRAGVDAHGTRVYGAEKQQRRHTILYARNW